MIDFERLFNDFSIPYWITGKNVSKGWINISCPICGDVSNHGGFNIETGKYNCWKCGKHNSIYILQLLLRKSKNEIIKILDNYSFFNKKIVKDDNKNSKEQLEFLGYELKEIHRNYLIKRNFNPDLIKSKYKITGFTFENMFWQYRLMIPIFYNFNIVNYVGRDVSGKQQRYLNLPNKEAVIDLKNILYNLDNVRQDKIIVVEGIFDVWRGGDNFVATFGTSFTKQQIMQILRFDRIYIIFDCEYEAQNKAKQLANILSGFSKKVSVIDLQLKDRDLADLTEEEVKELRRFLK